MNMPIYQQAMGAGFARLQPELQDYFSLAPGSGRYGVGEGVFDVVGCRRPRWLRPLLGLTASEEAFFPEYDERVPFRIENHAHLDPFGRSSLTARRQIFFPGRTRIFQDTTSVRTCGSRPPLRSGAAGGLCGQVPPAGHRPEPERDGGGPAPGSLRGVPAVPGTAARPAAGGARCQGLRRAVVGPRRRSARAGTGSR